MPDQEPVDPVTTTEQTFPASYVHEIRNEAAAYRQRMKVAEAKAADYEKVVSELGVVKAERRDLKISGALNDIAAKLGVNPKLTKAVLNDEGRLAGLDPDGRDFLPALESMVAVALENTPELRGQAPSNAPVRSGSDLTSIGVFSPPKELPNREDLQHLTPEETYARYKSGQLNDILGRTR
jgi:hypothetical protein